MTSAVPAPRKTGQPASPLRVTRTPGIIIFADANTTVGYCRYDNAGEVEYIFVHPAFRRKGYALQLLALVEAERQCPLRFQPPISPLGQSLIAAYRAVSKFSDVL